MSAIAPIAVAAILMLGTLAAISLFNHASAQESSNAGNATEGANNPEQLQELNAGNATEGANNPEQLQELNAGNATEGANNPEPLQEMVPAMTFTPIHITTTTKQLSKANLPFLVENERQKNLPFLRVPPKLITNQPNELELKNCQQTVCVESASHTGRPVPTAEASSIDQELGKKGFVWAIKDKSLPGGLVTLKPCINAPVTEVVKGASTYLVCLTEEGTPPPVATGPASQPAQSQGGAHTYIQHR